MPISPDEEPRGESNRFAAIEAFLGEHSPLFALFLHADKTLPEALVKVSGKITPEQQFAYSTFSSDLVAQALDEARKTVVADYHSLTKTNFPYLFNSSVDGARRQAIRNDYFPRELLSDGDALEGLFELIFCIGYEIHTPEVLENSDFLNAVYDQLETCLYFERKNLDARTMIRDVLLKGQREWRDFHPLPDGIAHAEFTDPLDPRILSRFWRESLHDVEFMSVDDPLWLWRRELPDDLDPTRESEEN